jgi:hypothetical protein
MGLTLFAIGGEEDEFLVGLISENRAGGGSF